MAHDYRLSRSRSSNFLTLLFLAGYLLSTTVAQNDTCQGKFMCGGHSQPSCVSLTFLCDGYLDCFNGEDESSAAGCENVTRHDCPRRHQTKCTDWDGRCYNENYRCDGVSDCWTGLDERNCSYANCSSSAFQCGVGLCIDASKTCDGRWDCRDGSDESSDICDSSMCNLATQLFCPRNTIDDRCVNMTAFCDRSKSCEGQTYTTLDCNTNSCPGSNNPCEHICSNLMVGYQCQCRTGYQLVNKTRCTDIDECAVTPHVCSQRCTNNEGSYACSCGAKYTSTSDGRCIRSSTAPEPYLIFGNRYYVHRMSINGTNYTRIPELHTFVHVIDIDDKTDTIYYVDLGVRSLNKMRNDGSGATLLDRYYGYKVEGIAVDWIGRKLYWTSTNLRGIYVSEMNASFTTSIVKDTSAHCRGIAVHPAAGYVFWSDWGTYPFIGRIGMDGTQQKYIVTRDIYWPNGVTVDYNSDRLFWADAQTVRLECSDLDGNNRVRLNVRMSHPYGIAVFEDFIYWTDWNFKSIHRADKFTGNNSVTLLYNMPIQPFDIKVHSPLRQPPGNNPCGSNNGGCSHLCLIAPGGTGYSCACPQNMPLLSDQRTCNLSCSEAQFTCNQGDFRCIPWFFRCNGIAECLNGEDELNCSSRVCTSSTSMQCERLSSRYRNCWGMYDVCDGIIDCEDGSDENRTKCESRVCQMWEFKCWRTGRCIPSSAQCNGRRDCPHYEDELPQNPNCRNRSVCRSDEFTCDNGECIDASWYCDFDNDCGDMSDEPSTCWQYREEHPCPAGYRRCPHNYRCIPQNRFCDSLNDCRDLSDERPEYCSCKDGDFTCDNHHCIPMRWRCDCTDDCGDGSDENRTLCADLYRPCTQSEFLCDECRCLSLALKCNGNQDCRDATDEDNCTCPANTTFQCQHGAQCIDISLRCDGNRDCLGDSSDEENCTRPCDENEFRCDNSICISTAWLCDGHDNCGDNSDERQSNCPACPAGQFQCPQVRHCILQSQVCDGIRHCEYGADELPPHCNDTCVSHTAFRCNNSRCVHAVEVCNGQDDCGDGSDERDCPSVCDRLQNHWCPQGCDMIPTRKNDTYACTCNEDLGFLDLYGNGRRCIPEDGQKGVLVYSSGRKLYGYNLTGEVTFWVADTSYPVSVLDVDSVRDHVYWIDASRMRRVMLNDNLTLTAPVQDLCTVENASGIAYDWITRNVYWTEMSGRIEVTSVKFVCVKTTLVSRDSSTFVPTSIVINPNTRKLYFINSYYAMPTIMTVSTSGSQLHVLINSELEQPTDLTIDFNMGGRLFWTDRHKNVIESCKADGTDRTVMFTEKSGRSPVMLDIFAGVIYWTPWSRDRVRMTENIGRGNTTELLVRQTSIEATRFAHELRYGVDTINECDRKNCSLCLLDVVGYRCVCPENTDFISGTQLCDLPPNDPHFANLEEPAICTILEYVANQYRCPITTTTTRPTTTSTTTTSTTTVKSAPSSPSSSTVGTVPGDTQTTTSPAVIAVVVIILLLVIVALIIVGVWAYRRGHFERVRKAFTFQTLEEDTSTFDQPDDGQPPYGRAVSFDGSNVDFGNPLYNTTNDDKIDTTPAYDDGDKKYMPGIGELASQTYIKGNVDNLSTDA